jgi:hypothetical protein
MWHEALEEASRLYFGRNNIKVGRLIATRLLPAQRLDDGRGCWLCWRRFIA